MADDTRLRVSVDLTELAPIIREAVRATIREELASLQDAPKRSAWVAKKELATYLRISVATVDRLDREGAPFERVGNAKRYELTKYREWLKSRGAGPTTKVAPMTSIDGDTERLLGSQGLTLVRAR
jgi:hypothetical protein